MVESLMVSMVFDDWKFVRFLMLFDDWKFVVCNAFYQLKVCVYFQYFLSIESLFFLSSKD
jgi:hypothetical protein